MNLQEALARIAVLESFLDHTADGALVVECEHLYCPKCNREVEQTSSVGLCWNCLNPDSYNDIPLPLSYSACLSRPK
jgi:predicted amidophosphoribosyltransferase